MNQQSTPPLYNVVPIYYTSQHYDMPEPPNYINEKDDVIHVDTNDKQHPWCAYIFFFILTALILIMVSTFVGLSHHTNSTY